MLARRFDAGMAAKSFSASAAAIAPLLIQLQPDRDAVSLLSVLLSGSASGPAHIAAVESIAASSPSVAYAAAAHILTRLHTPSSPTDTKYICCCLSLCVSCQFDCFL